MPKVGPRRRRGRPHGEDRDYQITDVPRFAGTAASLPRATRSEGPRRRRLVYIFSQPKHFGHAGASCFTVHVTS